ncbi:MAG: hypothetical protein LBI37_02000, partial [Puniceicoccales bacterium]|nr:hypothetical protein [Puniceicoccales bacterium]
MNSDTVSYLSSVFMAMMMCIVRLSAALSLLPAFSKQFIVGVGRGVVIFGMALPLFPHLYPTLPNVEHLPLWVFIATMCKEVVIRRLLGFLGGFIFFVADRV